MFKDLPAPHNKTRSCLSAVSFSSSKTSLFLEVLKCNMPQSHNPKFKLTFSCFFKMSFHGVLFLQQVRLEKLKLPSVVVFIITMYPNVWTGDVSACLPTLLMFHLLTFQKHFFINQLNKIKELTYGT